MRCLLMGGQACVLYGAAEFSRDVDFAILEDSANLDRLTAALNDLQAERIAVPPFDRQWLEMWLALHFRCRHPAAPRLWIDLMSRMRGVDDFPELWDRRSTFALEGGAVDVIGLPDLVKAKKTQREKDWPMITRLVDANCLAHRDAPTPDQIRFWLLELRTPRLLVEQAATHLETARRLLNERDVLSAAMAGDEAALRQGLDEEKRREQDADRSWWVPLKAEMERLRHARNDTAPSMDPPETGD